MFTNLIFMELFIIKFKQKKKMKMKIEKIENRNQKDRMNTYLNNATKNKVW